MIQPVALGWPWTASELRKLSKQGATQFWRMPHRAESQYATNPELTDFEAFGEDDLHGKCTAAPER